MPVTRDCRTTANLIRASLVSIADDIKRLYGIMKAAIYRAARAMADCLRHCSASFAKSCELPRQFYKRESMLEALPMLPNHNRFSTPFHRLLCYFQYPVLFDLSNAPHVQHLLNSTTPNHMLPATLCSRTRVHHTLMALFPWAPS